MSKYAEFLPELKSTTLFQNIPDNDLLALLDAMNPEIAVTKAGSEDGPAVDIDNGIFCVVLKGIPLDRLEERLDVYNMPKPKEPGMMMAEIPVLSEMRNSKRPKPAGGFKPPHHHAKKPVDFDLYMLRMTADMVTKFYNEDVAAAQSIMLKNFLGILAQKVTDVRKEKRALQEQFEAVGFKLPEAKL